MGTSKTTGLRYADLPSVEVARFADNPSASRAMEQLRQIVAIRFGKSGQEQDRAVTWGDLVESGFATMMGKTGVSVGAPSPSGIFQPNFPVVVDAVPPAPSGLTVTPGLSTVTLIWNRPNFNYFGYAEIYRGTENNLSTAVSVGQTTAWLYADQVSSAATYYYWVRFVSKGGKVGPFNAVDGIAGVASLDPAYLIDVLSADDPKALLYNIPADTIINGVAVPAGVYVRDLYVANGSISNAKIGNAAIDDAKIASLNAVKIIAGEMSGDRIEVNTLNGDRLIANTLAAKLATISTAYINEANLNNAIITNGKMKGPLYSDNYVYGQSGWNLDRDTGNLYANNGEFRGSVIGGQLITGAFTGYAWPPSGGIGSYLGPSGLLIGNANDGKYLQVTADGQIYAPGFSVVNGALSISQLNVINTANIANNAVTVSAYFSLPTQNVYIHGGSTADYGYFQFYLPQYTANLLLFYNVLATQISGQIDSATYQVFVDGVARISPISLQGPGGRSDVLNMPQGVMNNVSVPGLGAGTHTIMIRMASSATTDWNFYLNFYTQIFMSMR